MLIALLYRMSRTTQECSRLLQATLNSSVVKLRLQLQNGSVYDIVIWQWVPDYRSANADSFRWLRASVIRSTETLSGSQKWSWAVTERGRTRTFWVLQDPMLV